MPDQIAVGTLAGAFGVQGEVRLKSYCADPLSIVDYVPLHDAAGNIYSAIALKGQTKGALIARIHGIESKEEADALRGTVLYVDRERLPDLPDDEYYYSDLIGLEVVDTGGENFGQVQAVYDHGAGDILEIRRSGQQQAMLLPFTLQSVPTVDLKRRRIIVDPPEEIPGK